ncbi:helix-turn-helix transcriptional regulator [Burkholderia pyrrocinia]|uniref:helix-turn-helix domain-containing protein n=1 Tax=Burkholderia pyrrocinia TaxID=60550 RepID=UPI002AB0BDE5|nr:helix-turn-helix transcriptional regulator [Burkholderia pyrrocinia]
MVEKKGVQPVAEQSPVSSLGAFIRKARQDVGMTLRDVEEATNKEISNGYLSQLEGGKINRPSPHVLYSLSNVLRADYEVLMQRAGYILPGASPRQEGEKPAPTGTYSIDNLTAEEEAQLLQYLEFLRSKKK